MSGVVKGVGKIFKKVLKVVKKVAPVVLAAAAIYMTAGAALGVSSAAGGWGAAASSLSSNLGLSGTLGKIVTGAVTQAGYGAAIGAATSAVTGGNIMDGMQRGALTGAVTGGVTGGLGFETDPLKGAFDGDKMAGGVGQDALAGSGSGDMLGTNITGSPWEASGGDPFGTISGQAGDLDAGGVMAGASAPTPAASSASAGAATGGGNGFFAEGGWLERNQALAGGVVKGVGQGLLQGMSAKDGNQAALQRLQQIRDSYQTGGNGLLLDGPGERSVVSAPMHAGGIERNAPALQSGPGVTAGTGARWRYQYDPRRGQIVPVRIG